MSNPTPNPTPKPIVIDADATYPLDDIDKTLRESFAKDIAEQCNRLDELAKQLITAQLAIPGIFAAILKLVSGDAATVSVVWQVPVAYIVWLTGMGLTWFSLFPKKHVTDRDSLTEIENYFTNSAKRKYWCLVPASALTFGGIMLAVWSIYIK